MHYYSEFDPHAAQWLRNLMDADLIPKGVVDERDIREVQPDDLRGFVQCHFFAGIAGWPLALRLAGWPEDREVWSGSCPCQPFSSAGKRKGKTDDRHLWPEFYRLISECKPATAIGEQVASKDGLAWYAGVHADLEGAGYAVGCADLCAAGVGEKDHPQIRQTRMWAYELAERFDAVGDGRADILRDFAEWLGGIIVGPPHIRQRLFWVAHAGHTSMRRGTEPVEKERGQSWCEIAGCSSVSGLANGNSRRLCECGECNCDTIQSEQQTSQRDNTGRCGTVSGLANGKRSGIWGSGLATDGTATEGVQGTNGERERLRPNTGAKCRRVVFDFTNAEPIDVELLRSQGRLLPGYDEAAAAIERVRGLELPVGDERRGAWLADGRTAQTEGPSDDGGMVLSDVSGCKSRQLATTATGHGCAIDSTSWANWSDFRYVPCGDGKTRRIESGVQPLVDGTAFRLADGRTVEGASRTKLLRGIGNAIVPQVAATFIRAFMEIMDEECEVA